MANAVTPDRNADMALADAEQSGTNSLTLGDYAHTVIAKQYRRLVKQEQGVLKDKDPEYLHQMRVGTRRLRTALQVFGRAVDLPKAAREKAVQELTRTLGHLRDLDVQIAALQSNYRPQLPTSEQKLLDKATANLKKQRQKAFAAVEAALTQPHYQSLKAAYEQWLQQPRYTRIAQLPLSLLLPDLLSPLLSELLLHPAWLISTEENTGENRLVLHELRKVCKKVRYQTEFFTDLYGEEFSNWVNELKQLQEDLGTVQDTHVLLEILEQQGSPTGKLPELHQAIDAEQMQAMSYWESVRQQYLSAEFRARLHQMILAPLTNQL
ncbi:MAG: CHAD domain-containing protein [Synechococcales cyanobacterium C42_A2020_086]|jgi:CHAD domain-containing protein|nr:CHAD domain-containing protein [Synechococcales cyanobacterium C42_A2020_086]